MQAFLLFRSSERLVAWVVYRDVEALKKSWAAAGWQIADQVRLDHPWPAAVCQVAYVGTHPTDDRAGG